jgi:hypothetical protein
LIFNTLNLLKKYKDQDTSLLMKNLIIQKIWVERIEDG